MGKRREDIKKLYNKKYVMEEEIKTLPKGRVVPGNMDCQLMYFREIKEGRNVISIHIPVGSLDKTIFNITRRLQLEKEIKQINRKILMKKILFFLP